MGILFDDASSEALSVGSSPVSDTPLTLCVWYKTNDNTIRQDLLSVVNNSGSLEDYVELRLRGDSGDEVQARINATGSGGSNAVAGSSFQTNVWESAIGTFQSGNGRAQIYLNGVVGTQSGPKNPASPLDSIGVGSRFGSSANYMSGLIAEVCIYDTLLNQQQITAIARGADPRRVKRSSLVFYAPLFNVNTLNDRVGQRILSTAGTPTSGNDHPPIRRNLWVFPMAIPDAGGEQNLSPSNGSVNLVGATPVLEVDNILTPSNGVISLTGQAISLETENTITPTTGSIDLTSTNIGIFTENTLTPVVGSVDLTSVNIELEVENILTPTNGVVTLTGHAPELDTGTTFTLEPTTGLVTLAGLASIIEVDNALAPTVGVIDITGNTVTVIIPGVGETLTPQTGVVTITGFAPKDVNTDIWNAIATNPAIWTPDGANTASWSAEPSYTTTWTVN